MLGWILLGLLTTAAIVIVISGIIDESRIREEIREKDLRSVMVKAIDQCTNTVKLQDLDSDQMIEIQGDGIDDDLRVYDTISA